MKLKELVENMGSYHFMVKVVSQGTKDKLSTITDVMYDTPHGIVGIDNMTVVNIWAKNEVSQEGAIDHSLNIQPIVVVMVKDY